MLTAFALTGFANFAFLEPDQKLRIHFDPGTRYAYSGEGFILLQFAIEHGRKDKGLGLDVGELTQKGIFEPLGMTRTSLKWRADFADNLADGWNDKGASEAHDERSKARAAGSMDTTIADLAKFAAAFADDVAAEQAAFMADSQVPWGVEALGGKNSEPAWKAKPSWYLVTADDRMIPPDAQRSMAKRAGATVTEVKGSHSVYVSQPKAVADLIEKAADSVKAAAA